MSKSIGKQYGWRLLERKLLTQTYWCEIREDKIDFNGKNLTYTYLVSPGAVFAIPITKEGKFILLKNYRWTVDDVCWEVPSGLRKHPTAKTLEEIARAEMKEEAGCVGGNLHYIGEYYSANGVCSLKIALYIAENVSLEESAPEDTESIIEVSAFSRQEVEMMLDRNEISDGDSALSLLLAFRYLDRAGSTA